MDDNTLLDSFFQDARRQQIDDDGFSSRVMASLPQLQADLGRELRLSRLWTLFCIALAVVLFLCFTGWGELLTDFLVFVGTLPVNYNSLSVLLSLMVFSWLGIVVVARRVRLYL